MPRIERRCCRHRRAAQRAGGTAAAAVMNQYGTSSSRIRQLGSAVCPTGNWSRLKPSRRVKTRSGCSAPVDFHCTAHARVCIHLSKSRWLGARKYRPSARYKPYGSQWTMPKPGGGAEGEAVDAAAVQDPLASRRQAQQQRQERQEVGQAADHPRDQ